jgi:tetratricopeptide (TPR) repeat protein
LKDYFVSRLQADARIDTGEPALIADAKTRLSVLWTNDRLSTLHRAEVAHNLGYAHERLGETDDAARWYRRALEVNPHLQMASSALTRLGEIDPTAEPEGSLNDPSSRRQG